jgi:hypothetical protein
MQKTGSRTCWCSTACASASTWKVPERRFCACGGRIESDPRHVQSRVVYEGALAQRRCERFEMGLAEVDEDNDDDLGAIHQLDAAEALTRFLALRPRFDIAG